MQHGAGIAVVRAVHEGVLLGLLVDQLLHLGVGVRQRVLTELLVSR